MDVCTCEEGGKQGGKLFLVPLWVKPAALAHVQRVVAAASGRVVFNAINNGFKWHC